MIFICCYRRDILMLFTQHYDGCYDFIFYLKFSDEIFRTRTFKKKKVRFFVHAFHDIS